MAPGHGGYLPDAGRSAEGLFKAKVPSTLGTAFPSPPNRRSKSISGALKKQHHAARHVPYAWMLGFDGTHHRSSDDGEPSNSAGPPILGVIQAHNLTHVLFAVVRYFGGTKLGVGGLIEAYREGRPRRCGQVKLSSAFAPNAFALHSPTSTWASSWDSSNGGNWNLPPPTSRFPVRWKWTFA